MMSLKKISETGWKQIVVTVSGIHSKPQKPNAALISIRAILKFSHRP